MQILVKELVKDDKEKVIEDLGSAVNFGILVD